MRCATDIRNTFTTRLKKDDRVLLRVLDVLLEATERRNKLRRGRQFEDEPELEGFVLDQTRTARQSFSPEDNLQGFERQACHDWIYRTAGNICITERSR